MDFVPDESALKLNEILVDKETIEMLTVLGMADLPWVEKQAATTDGRALCLHVSPLHLRILSRENPSQSKFNSQVGGNRFIPTSLNGYGLCKICFSNSSSSFSVVVSFKKKNVIDQALSSPCEI